MRKRLVILLLLVVAVWCAVYFWPEEVSDGEAPDFIWPELTAAKVQSIEVNATGFSFELLSVQGDWRVSLPGRQARPLADKEKVASLLDFMSHNRPQRRLGEIDDPADFGLHEPRSVVMVDKKGLIRVGDANPSGDGVYARVAGEGELLLLPREYAQVLTRPAEYYFDTRLFALEPDKVRSIAYDSGNGGWLIERKADGPVFKVPEEKAGDKVSAQELDLYLHTLLNMKALRLLFGESFQDREPALELRISSQEKEFFFRAAPWKEGRYICVSTRQPLPFVLEAEQIRKLEKSAFQLTDRRLVDLDLGKVEKIRIAGPVRELVAVKSETGWKREGGPGDILGIDMNLWRLTDLKYESEPVKSLTESASHGLTLSMWDNQGELLAELSFYADPALPEGLCWMSKSEQRMFYPVSDRLFKDLQGQLPPAGEAANGGSSGNTSEKAE